LNSAMNLGEDVTLDISLRHVAKLPEPELPAYTELTARLAWQLSRSWELSVRGVNLLHKGHQEYPDPDGVVIGRSAMAEVRWRP
ncbi:MAG TPA: TonB-dependent receptor, partial [Steroidobacteraceae bacterium]|nr:TonB-dependent receptor [Steroidobacteraceae bacterium]